MLLILRQSVIPPSLSTIQLFQKDTVIHTVEWILLRSPQRRNMSIQVIYNCWEAFKHVVHFAAILWVLHKGLHIAWQLKEQLQRRLSYMDHFLWHSCCCPKKKHTQIYFLWFLLLKKPVTMTVLSSWWLSKFVRKILENFQSNLTWWDQKHPNWL